MWGSYYAEHALIALPLVAMGIFMVAFVAAVARALTKHTSADPLAQMPLEGLAEENQK